MAPSDKTVIMSELLQALTAAGWITRSVVDPENLRIDFSEDGLRKARLLKSLLDEIGYPPTRSHMEALHAVLQIADSP
jgi:hypothetical protein